MIVPVGRGKAESDKKVDDFVGKIVVGLKAAGIRYKVDDRYAHFCACRITSQSTSVLLLTLMHTTMQHIILLQPMMLTIISDIRVRLTLVHTNVSHTFVLLTMRHTTISHIFLLLAWICHPAIHL